MEIVLFTIVTVVFLAGGIPAFCIFGYYRVRRKGYRAPSAAVVLGGGGAVGMFAAIAGAYLLPIEADSIFIIKVIFWYPFAAFVFVTAFVIWILPRRNPRVFGPRRPHFPFATAGIVLIALGYGAVLLAIVKGASIGDAVKLAIIISAFGLPLIALGRRTKTTVSIEKVEATDPRAPVLYLRPFNQERNAFVFGPKSRYGDYVTGLQSSIMTLGEYSFGGANEFNPDPNVTVRFEEYIGRRLTATLGPFLALGNPEDYTTPEGAVRTYAGDSDWKDYVVRLARKSCCIVAEVSSSENLKWEFEYLRQEGLQQKLFIMTRPVVIKQQRYLRWLGQQSTTWGEFAAALGASGYEVPHDPGLGAVITFDDGGRGIVLKTGAQTPEDYIGPIRTFLGISSDCTPVNLDPAAAPTPNATAPIAETLAPVVAETMAKPRGRLARFASSGWTVTPLLLLAMFGADIVKGPLEARRARALTELAPQLGFTLIADKGAVGDADLAQCDLLTGDKNTAVLYAMQGTVSGHRALLFDYRYDWESDDRDGGTTTHTEFQTVAAFAGAGPKLPPFKLNENTFGNRMKLTGADGSRHVEFAESPGFSKEFILMSSDKISTRELFAPGVRNFFMRSLRRQWYVEGAGSWLVLYRPSTRVDPKEWRNFLQETPQIAFGFFQSCSRDASSPNVAATLSP